MPAHVVGERRAVVRGDERLQGSRDVGSRDVRDLRTRTAPATAQALLERLLQLAPDPEQGRLPLGVVGSVLEPAVGRLVEGPERHALVVPLVRGRGVPALDGSGEPRDDPLAERAARLGHPHGVNTTFTMPSSLSRNLR